MAHNVLYYICDGNTAPAQAILDTMKGGDQINLVGCAHEPLVPPAPQQLAG